MQKFNQNDIHKCVIYARFSCHNQTEQSIEGQLHDCIQFAQKHNMQIVGQYIDRAMTATSDKRPDFQRMIADSSGKAFDTVLVWKLDRFSRDRYDSAIYKNKLKRNGVRVMSVMENITDTPEGILMESILEGYAEYFSRDLAQKVTRGMKETAKKHKITGHIPFGYTRSADNTYIPDPFTAPAVKKIFNMYLSGEKKSDIAGWLNEHGYKTSYGNCFTKDSITPIVQNQRYVGRYTYSDIEIVDEKQRIVDDDLFEKVQRKVHAGWHKGSMRRAKDRYLLTSKLYCGECKNVMHGESGQGRNNQIYLYYLCSGRKKKHICSHKNVKKDFIEDFVLNTITKDIVNNNVINKIIDKMIEIQETESVRSNEITILQNQLNSIQHKINNIIKALEAGIITATTQQRLQELETSKSKIEYELSVAIQKKLRLARMKFCHFLRT